MFKMYIPGKIRNEMKLMLVKEYAKMVLAVLHQIAPFLGMNLFIKLVDLETNAIEMANALFSMVKLQMSYSVVKITYGCEDHQKTESAGSRPA